MSARLGSEWRVIQSTTLPSRMTSAPTRSIAIVLRRPKMWFIALDYAYTAQLAFYTGTIPATQGYGLHGSPVYNGLHTVLLSSLVIRPDNRPDYMPARILSRPPRTSPMGRDHILHTQAASSSSLPALRSQVESGRVTAFHSAHDHTTRTHRDDVRMPPEVKCVQ